MSQRGPALVGAISHPDKCCELGAARFATQSRAVRLLLTAHIRSHGAAIDDPRAQLTHRQNEGAAGARCRSAPRSRNVQTHSAAGSVPAARMAATSSLRAKRPLMRGRTYSKRIASDQLPRQRVCACFLGQASQHDHAQTSHACAATHAHVSQTTNITLRKHILYRVNSIGGRITPLHMPCD